MTVATHELDAVVRRGHADPHSVLGAHSLDVSVVVTVRQHAPSAHTCRMAPPSSTCATH